jgi:hypothetical protein
MDPNHAYEIPDEAHHEIPDQAHQGHEPPGDEKSV